MHEMRDHCPKESCFRIMLPNYTASTAYTAYTAYTASTAYADDTPYAVA